MRYIARYASVPYPCTNLLTFVNRVVGSGQVAGAAFWEGYDARLKGDADVLCPYPVESQLRSDWLEGWHDEILIRYFGEKPPHLA